MSIENKDKRIQPRSRDGQFANLPPRQPEVPTPNPLPLLASPSSDSIGSSERANTDKLAEIYTRFKEKHGRAPVIGLDLDGTTANMVAGFREVMAKSQGISPEQAKSKLPEPDEYAMWTGEAAWFTSKQEFLTHFQEAEKTGMYRDLPAYDGASEVIHRLVQEGFDVKAVTARSEDYNSDTAHWINSQGLPIDEILHPGFLKHTVEEVDIFFDDAPHVINDLVERQRKVLIFDQNYNGHQAVDHETHTRRVQGWDIDKVSQALEELL